MLFLRIKPVGESELLGKGTRHNPGLMGAQKKHAGLGGRLSQRPALQADRNLSRCVYVSGFVICELLIIGLVTCQQRAPSAELSPVPG